MQAKKIQNQNHKTNQHCLKSLPDQNHYDSPLGSHSRTKNLQPSSSNHPSNMSPKSRSGGRSRRNSKNKLFEKAHSTSQGQTFLKDTRIQYSLSSEQTTRSTPLMRKNSLDRLSSLSVNKEIDLKISGRSTDEQSQLSKLILQFDCEGAFQIINLSSIKQDGYQTGSQIQVDQSFLRNISSK